MGPGAGSPRIAKLVVAVLMPLGLLPAAASAAAALPARFQVGAARESIAPNVPIYAGGFGIGDPISTVRDQVNDPIEVRALYISNGTRAVAFVVADVQAFFPAYQEGPQFGTAAIRRAAADAISQAQGVRMGPEDIVVQGSYTHSGATLEGLWGPVPLPYLELVHQRAIQALTEAAAHARPAYLQATTVDAPQLIDTVLNQGGEYAGWSTDHQVSVLRAADPCTGGTIANDYGQMVKPGLQLLASPASGDSEPAGTFTTSLQAIYSPAHTGGSPLAGSKVHWDLGDGTTADTAATKDPGAPGPTYFDHAYAPGTYVVKATGADTAGHPVSAQMTVRVFPRLVPTIAARPGRGGAISYTGDATGGDGSVLAWRWSFSDGGTAEGRQVTHTFVAGTTPGATLTVTDGTGSTASTSTTDRPQAATALRRVMWLAGLESRSGRTACRVAMTACGEPGFAQTSGTLGPWCWT